MTRSCPNAAQRRHLKCQLAVRDGRSCFYCAAPFTDLAAATIDHLIPYTIWPTWAQANLVLACYPCNQAKGSQLPQAFLRPVGYRPGLVLSPRAGIQAFLYTAIRAAARAAWRLAQQGLGWNPERGARA